MHQYFRYTQKALFWRNYGVTYGFCFAFYPQTLGGIKHRYKHFRISEHKLRVTGIVLKWSSPFRVTFFTTGSSYQAQSCRSTDLQCNLEHTALYFLLDTSRSHRGFRRKSTFSMVIWRRPLKKATIGVLLNTGQHDHRHV